jgi:Arginine-tRNA-protein transferase, N terminus
VKDFPSSPLEEALTGHAVLTRALESRLGQALPLPGEPSACPYLPGRRARHVTVRVPAVSGLYHAFMDLNFRRIGPFFYRPQCEE